MYRIKNWGRFQHFKLRRPPWIKLYRDILDDIEFHNLDGETAKILVGLWLLASEGKNGALPEVEVIAFRLRKSSKDITSAISKLSHWVHRDDISAISARYQNDPSETETEAERETEKEPEGRPAAATGESGIADLVQKIKACRPEFAALNVMDLENRIRSVPIAAAQMGVDDFCRDMVASLTLPAVPGKMLTGYLRKAQPIAKKKPIVSRDSAIRDAVRALTEASATGDISRCMKALHDKYRDFPHQNGQTVAGEALEIWKFQDKQGREVAQNAPQAAI